MTNPGDFNSKIIEEFRANGGKVGGPFEGGTMLLLHHTGAKTGTRRVTPLAFQQVGNGYAIFASKAGAPTNPDWYHNLVANPETEIEVGEEKVKVRARVTEDSERSEIWENQKKLAPNFAEYDAKVAGIRTIPVVVLEPVH
jgi:deazaflavin-dependent oxidoreductase (nitroreductase family)